MNRTFHNIQFFIFFTVNIPKHRRHNLLSDGGTPRNRTRSCSKMFKKTLTSCVNSVSSFRSPLMLAEFQIFCGPCIAWYAEVVNTSSSCHLWVKSRVCTCAKQNTPVSIRLYDDNRCGGGRGNIYGHYVGLRPKYPDGLADTGTSVFAFVTSPTIDRRRGIRGYANLIATAVRGVLSIIRKKPPLFFRGCPLRPIVYDLNKIALTSTGSSR